MNLYNLHDEPETLKGHHEKDDLILDEIDLKIRKEYRRLRYEKEYSQKQSADMIINDFLSPTALKRLSNEAEAAFEFARDIVGGRWKLGEKAIAKNPNVSYNYAIEILKKRWPQAEPALLKSTGIAIAYAQWVIKGPWPELEHVIITKAPNYFPVYCRSVIKGAWSKGEPAYLKYIKTHHIASAATMIYEYVNEIKKARWPEAEDILKHSPAIVLWEYYKQKYIEK